MPAWGGDALVDQPIRLLLGGSAANTAVHACHLMRSGLVNGGGFESGGYGGDYGGGNRGTGGDSSGINSGSSGGCGADSSGGSGGGRTAAATTAPAAARPRDDCVLHSTLGRDVLGQLARERLAAAGVPLSEVRQAPHQGTCVCLSGAADRAFVTFRGSVGSFCADDIDSPRLLSASHVHFAGHYNTPALWPALPGLLVAARQRGATTSLGPQYDATEQWGGLDTVYPLLDVLVPNELEAARLSGREDARGAAEFFLACGVELVVITRGRHGALAAARAPRGPAPAAADGAADGAADDSNAAAAVGVTDAADGGAGSGGGSASASRGGGDDSFMHVWEHPCSDVTVVDTTGAGDAFAAGFLYAWKATGSVPTALAWGCALGSTVVTKVGASFPGTPEEIVANFIPPLT
ncbi:unnamed protein product [Phaeothamnion confervicola]